jgi:hypothetical protein
MVQAIWPDGSPITGVEVASTGPGKVIFSLEFRPTGKGPSLTEIELTHLGELEELTNIPPGVIGEGSEDFHRFIKCSKFVLLTMSSLPYDGEIVDDISSALICACFNDPELASEAENDLPSTQRLTIALMRILKCMEDAASAADEK